MNLSKKNVWCTLISIILLLSIILICFSNVNGYEAAALSSPIAAKQLVSPSGPSDFSPMANVANLSSAVISVVQSGTSGTSNINLGPNPNPIGTSINVDVRIDNVSTGFWGWSLPTLIWNLNVANITAVQEGPFLMDNTGGDPTAFIGNSKVNWFNWAGNVSGGLSEAIEGQDLSTDGSGVIATLTFLVTGPGDCTIGIEGGNLRANSSDLTGVNVACNNATITVLANSPTPTPTLSPTPTSTAAPTSTPTPTSSPSNTATSTPTTSPTIPEYPSWIIISVLIISILASLAYSKKKMPAKTISTI